MHRTASSTEAHNNVCIKALLTICVPEKAWHPCLGLVLKVLVWKELKESEGKEKKKEKKNCHSTAPYICTLTEAAWALGQLQAKQSCAAAICSCSREAQQTPSKKHSTSNTAEKTIAKQAGAVLLTTCLPGWEDISEQKDKSVNTHHLSVGDQKICFSHQDCLSLWESASS